MAKKIFDEAVASKLDELRTLTGHSGVGNVNFSISEDEHGVTYNQSINDNSGNSESVTKRVAKQKP